MDYIDCAVNSLPSNSTFTAYQLFGHDYYASIQLFLRLSLSSCPYIWMDDANRRHNYYKP